MLKSIAITDGAVEFLGDGVAMVLQDSHEGVKDVVLTVVDLKAILAVLEG